MPEGWEIVPVYRGELAGFFCVKGHEIHCFRADAFKGRWLTRQDIERLTRPLFDKYGFITTSVRVANLQGHSFVQRLGFHPTSEDGTVVFYKAERLRHARF